MVGLLDNIVHGSNTYFIFTDGAAVGWGGEPAPVNDDAATGGGR